jgi:cysteine desulfurase
MRGMDVVYLDNNATTRPAPEVVQAMLPYLQDCWGNPSSVHFFGQRARKAVEDARASVAKLIGCTEAELNFTGSGTEGVNTALRGILAARSPRKRIITSTVEHSATRQLCAQLHKEGAEIVTIRVDGQGMPDLDALSKALDEDVALVSMLWVNNETGVIFPVDQIGTLCRNVRVPFHTDATQAVGKIPVEVCDVAVDAMSFAAHKFHGPKGVGGLYIRRGVRMRPLHIGGPQEHGRRGGTENVPGIVGMGKAAELAREFLPRMPRVAAQRDRLQGEILQRIAGTSVNGSMTHRVSNTTNISFARLEAEAILLLLSERGICASAGAACSSGSLEPSHVLLAMGIDPKIAHGAVRFSLSRYTTEAEIDRALEVLPAAIEKLRQVLPVGV